ncbi:MAG: hypothetical protein C4583_18135 [Anaerolineaceae bacterium]|nr:MAG: hypothetical protein C4583_18135 [Anaerolineaceae bacterium]
MKKWIAGTFLIVLIVVGVILAGAVGVQVGRGYLIVGKGLLIQDKATLTEMVAAGREAAGFYKPYLIVWAREGVQSQEYGLWSVNTETKEPMTGCLVPKTYLARSVALVTLDVDTNRLIARYGIEETPARLNGIVTGCWAFGIASGERGESLARVRGAMDKVRGERVVFGGGP